MAGSRLFCDKPRVSERLRPGLAVLKSIPTPRIRRIIKSRVPAASDSSGVRIQWRNTFREKRVDHGEKCRAPRTTSAISATIDAIKSLYRNVRVTVTVIIQIRHCAYNIRPMYTMSDFDRHCGKLLPGRCTGCL